MFVIEDTQFAVENGPQIFVVWLYLSPQVLTKLD